MVKHQNSIKLDKDHECLKLLVIKPNLASILEDSTLVTEGGNIIIKLESSYEFDFKQIEKNMNIIEEHLFDGSGPDEKKNIILVKNESNKADQESPSKEHPLLSSALDSFNGKIERYSKEEQCFQKEVWAGFIRRHNKCKSKWQIFKKN